MIGRPTKILLASAIFFVLAVLSHQTNKPVPTRSSNPCTLPSSPCIKITESDGATFKLNDFRFAPGHCIDFISLPDGTLRHYCGQYDLQWIGPDSAES